MKRTLVLSATGLLALSAACGAPNTGSDAGPRDVAATDTARSDTGGNDALGGGDDVLGGGDDGGADQDSSAGDDGAMDLDGGADTDSGGDLDAGESPDGSAAMDGASPDDTGAPLDASTPTDSGTGSDSAMPADASTLMCTAPRADCDHDAANGCEANLTTDAANCGACGHDCGRGTCTAGRCGPETLVSGLLVPAGDIAIDDTNLYWFSAPTTLTSTMGQIFSIPKAGGTRATVVSGLGNGEAGMQYHSGYLYYGTLRGASNSLVMERVAVTGGTRTVLAHWTPNYGTYAVGTSRFYAADPCFGGDPICSTGRESIVRLNNDGSSGGAIVLANRPGALVFGVDGTYVYFSDIHDTSHVSINRVPVAGGTVEALATNQTSGYVPSLGPDGYVYWQNDCTAGTPGTIMRVRPGMTAPQRLVTDVGCPEDTVLSDGVDVYWNGVNLAGNRSLIRHLHIGDSTADTMVSTANLAGNIRIDATHVYYVCGSTPTALDGICRIRR